MSLLLEIIVQSVADAKAAEAGGADRLEVVRDLDREGLTPALDTVRAILSEVQLPVRVMVRENDGYTVRDAQELAALQQAVAAFGTLGVDGAVVGFANGSRLDLDTTRAVVSAAPHLKVTFHRAFAVASDSTGALDDLQAVPQIDRILTTGGDGDWMTRRMNLEHLQSRAGSRLTILAGGGVDVPALQILSTSGRIREVHVGRAAREPQVPSAPVSVDRVKRLKVYSSSGR